MDRKQLLDDVERVVAALGELADSCVLVGGCAPLYYARDERMTDLRPTTDVDLIVDVSSYAQFSLLEARLRRAGFHTPDPATGPHPIFRLALDGKLVDFMPVQPVLGHPVNEWYPSAVAASIRIGGKLGRLRVVDPVHFVATKLVAFDSRGSGDYLLSHDMEDAVWCLRAVPGVIENLESGGAPVHGFVRNRLATLVREGRFRDALPGHFEPDSGSQALIPGFLRDLARACRESSGA
jgi:hypothetical protein